MANDESREGKEPVSIYGMVMMMLEQTATVSWQKLGLQPDMITGRIEPNLVEAKVAIDLAAHLTQVIDPQLDEDDRRQIHGLIRDLKINYVQKSSGAGS